MSDEREPLWSDARIIDIADSYSTLSVSGIECVSKAGVMFLLATMRAEYEARLYELRNGEAFPPTVSGWYWWDGALDGRKARGLVNVNMPTGGSKLRTIWPSWCDGWLSAEEMPGQWYGPVLPPWKEDER